MRRKYACLPIEEGHRNAFFDEVRSKGHVRIMKGIEDVEQQIVDRGYKGHRHKDEAEVYISHTRGITSPTIKRELRRRNAIGAIIGHTKYGGLLERNHLKGAAGDAINAILVAAGHNLRLLIAWFAALLRAICSLWLFSQHALVR